MGGLLTKLFFPSNHNNNSNSENIITEISDSIFVDEDDDRYDYNDSNEHVNSYEDDDTIGSIDSDDENIVLIGSSDDDDDDEMDDVYFHIPMRKKPY